MPSLRHLLEELGKLFGDPDDVRIPGQTYDEIVTEVKDSAGNDEEE